MALNIGVNVVEVDGRASPSIAAAPVSVAGFLLRAERGVANVPVPLRGMNDFAANFGGVAPGIFGSHAVRGFFDNGGTEAYAVRIVDGVKGKAARVMLPDSTNANTLEVRAGNRGREDFGSWGNRLSVRIDHHPRATPALPAQLRGNKTGPFALSAGQSVQVDANGEAVTITFAAKDFTAIQAASAAEVSAVVARHTTAFRSVAAPDGSLLLVSSESGIRSRLAVAGSAAEALGFKSPNNDSGASIAAQSTLAALSSVAGLAVGSAVLLESRGLVTGTKDIGTTIAADAVVKVTVDGAATAVDVKFVAGDFAGGLGKVTPEEVVVAVNRQARGFSAVLDARRRLVLRSDTYGPGSTIALAPGNPTDAGSALGLTGAVPVKGTRETRTLEGVFENGRYVTWSGGLAAQLPTQAARFRSAEFDLAVLDGELEVERFTSLSMQNALPWSAGTVINDQRSGSRFITVTDQDSAGGPVDDMPEAGTYQVGSTTRGDDGDPPGDLAFIGDPVRRTGLFAFDTVDIQLLACPDSTSPGVVNAALGYVERRGDAMFVGSPPPGRDLEGAKTYAAPFRGRKVYGAMYAPWINIVNPVDRDGKDPLLLVPPVGHILGMYARVAAARGVWKAPAGDEAMLASALGTEYDMTDADHTDLVRNGSVNGVRAVPGSGVIVDASRTLSTDTRWLYVNVRRLFNYVKSSLRDGLRWVAQEPHSEELRRSVRLTVVTPFLLGLWRQGAFGSDPAEQSFSVKCDAENNPPSEVNTGNFKVEVLFYPVKPAETILIVVGQQDSGSATAET
ncbi:phage tail sheath C-terminal domain-containing protein [Streptomyces sp. NPDC051018]|uniref:phage tail sheath C-terminal domain-containing protein n=1 Tax=Streptomyces sp. NPDC051018 TaxID=3365639 RepID=UPI003790E65C